MAIIKEYTVHKPGTTMFPAMRFGVIRTDSYQKSFAHITNLVRIAQADFPMLTDTSKIEVTLYGGRHYKGTMGIEFPILEHWTVPDDYQLISELEVTA